MLELRPDRAASDGLRILCLGAHPDDIEIGCAGTLLRLLDEIPALHLRWLVFSGSSEREREARVSAQQLVSRPETLSVDVLDFRDGYFPGQWAELKDAVRKLQSEPVPDLIFTHHGGDRHQDHRVISELTWQTFRDHLILEYEVPKYDGDLGRPNLFVPLDAELARRKARHLVETFASQHDKPWFDEDTFLGLSRLRGVECPSGTAHAEAFHCAKAVVRWAP